MTVEVVPDLADLAIQAKDEYRLATDAASNAVAHAMRGVLRSRSGTGGKWQAWCRAKS
jgi:hypothetical protein